MTGAALCVCALAGCTVGADEPADPSHTAQVPALYAAGQVSTGLSEVRMALRPDGRQMVWGVIREDGNLDLLERHLLPGGTWSAPAGLALNTPGEDFDPAFAPDGATLFFHSDRAGGYGKTDIYAAPVDGFAFGTPRNLGPAVNSAGAEWAPTPLPGGTLLFASDGWGGEGRHDLFVAAPGSRTAAPVNLGRPVNGTEEDFDAALSPDGTTLVFSRGGFGEGEGVSLFASTRTGTRAGALPVAGWSPPRPLALGCNQFTIGSAFLPGGGFAFASNCPGGAGRMDIWTLPTLPSRAEVE